MNDVAPKKRRVLVESSPTVPLISITVAERLGAALDPPGKEGLSRLTSRLIRRTGAGLTTEQLDERIDTLGAALSADVGYTASSFHGAVIRRSLDSFADLLIDVLSRPSLAEAEFERLVRETQAELVDARDHDREVAQSWFRRRLFEGHPYGRPVSGTPSSIGKLTLEDVKACYARVQSAENLVLAFAGDIDESAAQAIAERIEQALPRGEPAPDALPDPTLSQGRRLTIVDKPERTQTQILIGCLGTHPHDPDHIPLHVGNTIFGGTFTARLMHEVRSKRGWSYGAYSNLPYDRKRRGFSLWTFPKSSDAAACIALELELLEQWFQDGVTTKELAWAQRYLVRSHAFAVDTASKRVGQALDEELYSLPPRYYADYVDRVKAVTLGEVNDAIRTRITPKDLRITVLGTASEIGNPIRDAIPNLADSEVVPFDAEC